jgi:hypothetical protein
VVHGIRWAALLVLAGLVGAAGCAKGDENPGGGGAGGAGTGGAGAAGAAGSGGGGDAGLTCSSPSDCPAPANECAEATCEAGLCASRNRAPGSAAPSQTPGDCRENRCDGFGNFEIATDESDLPDDANPCTQGACNGTSPVHAPIAAGAPCGTDLTCDGKGKCVGCVTSADCPGEDSECATRTCIGGSCGFAYAAAGKPLAAQTAGDCKQSQCDGAGNVVEAPLESDVPVDGNQCTNDVCSGSLPSNPASSSGTPCTEGGGKVCNGTGACVACMLGSDCPGSDTPCSYRTCINSTCGTATLAAGTPTSSQTPGDCKISVCDSAGGVIQITDDSDLPNDSKQCTNDLCGGGVPTHPLKPAGSPCNEAGGQLCSDTGSCVECIIGGNCFTGVCQNNQCVAVTCNPNTIDCDGAASNGCECSGNLCCGASCPPPHNNGLGQDFSDCAPSGVPGNAATYSQALAMSARSAWPESGTDVSGKCVGPGGGDFVYRNTGTQCALWVYSGSSAGRVNLAATCACPSASSPTWY